jgi:predicted nucleotidyltransferase
MKYGLTNLELDFLRTKLIEPLEGQGARVFLFGSRSTGRFKKFSDVDLFYVTPKEMKIPSHFIYSLLAEIEESDFPYKIDLANYDDLALSYKANIDAQKIELSTQVRDFLKNK